MPAKGRLDASLFVACDAMVRLCPFLSQCVEAVHNGALASVLEPPNTNLFILKIKEKEMWLCHDLTRDVIPRDLIGLSRASFKHRGSRLELHVAPNPHHYLVHHLQFDTTTMFTGLVETIGSKHQSRRYHCAAELMIASCCRP